MLEGVIVDEKTIFDSPSRICDHFITCMHLHTYIKADQLNFNMN